MDPDETLKEIRRIRGELLAEGAPYDETAVDLLCTLVDDLDVWLTKGGFPPAEWVRNEPVVTR